MQGLFSESNNERSGKYRRVFKAAYCHRKQFEKDLKRLDYIREYCGKRNVSPTAVVSGYITSNALEGTALVSCSNIEQLIDILDNCDYELEKDVISYIDSL